MTKATKNATHAGTALPAKPATVAPARPSVEMGKPIRMDALEPADAAKMSACPMVGAARVVASAEQHTQIGKATRGDWSELSRELCRSMNRVGANDLRDLEGMLLGQAVALQSLFVRLTEGALSAETFSNYDLKFRYALRAQAQCRATLETLAAIKNPPVVFARQANVANGPQQINNGIARAETAESRQNEVSGETIELRPNGSSPTTTLSSDSPMAPVGTLNGSAHGQRQGKVVAQRLEGRRTGRAPRAVQTPQAAGARRRGDRRGANGTAPLVSSAD